MTKDQADEVRQDIEKIVNKIRHIDQGLADQEFGETDDPELDEVIINIDDGDIEEWMNDLEIVKNKLEEIQNKLSVHL